MTISREFGSKNIGDWLTEQSLSNTTIVVVMNDLGHAADKEYLLFQPYQNFL
jgi:hypothetical protein